MLSRKMIDPMKANLEDLLRVDETGNATLYQRHFVPPHLACAWQSEEENASGLHADGLRDDHALAARGRRRHEPACTGRRRRHSRLTQSAGRCLRAGLLEHSPAMVNQILECSSDGGLEPTRSDVNSDGASGFARRKRAAGRAQHDSSWQPASGRPLQGHLLAAAREHGR